MFASHAAAHPTRVALLACAALLSFAAPRTTLAQQRTKTFTDTGATHTVRDGDWMVSVNPLGLVAGGLSGEAERRLGDARSAALSATYWSAWGANYLSVDAKLRFYQRQPGAKVLVSESAPSDFEGLSVYPLLGFQRIWESGCSACGLTGVTVGGGLDYGWRLGSEKEFALLAGLGVKTGFYGSQDEESVSAHVTYPFVRLGVGYVLGR